MIVERSIDPQWLSNAYLVADRWLHVSGVLAVVSAGIWLGARASKILSPNARLQGFGFWSTLVFLLNGSVFLMIGLQLPTSPPGCARRATRSATASASPPRSAAS